MLMRAPNRPVPRNEIFDQLWANQGGVSLNVVDVYVGYLRGKLVEGRAGGPPLVTVGGRGFMLDLAQARWATRGMTMRRPLRFGRRRSNDEVRKTPVAARGPRE